MVLQDESPRSKSIDTTLTQVWPKKGQEDETVIADDIEKDTSLDIYEYSKKIRRQLSRESGESDGRRRSKSPSSQLPSTVLCSSNGVAAKGANDEYEASDGEFHRKRKRQNSPSQSTRTTTTSSPTITNSGVKKGRIACEACFRKDLKIADLRTKCAQMKGDRDALREKQLLVHRITSVDTEFLHSSERSGYKK